MGEIFFIADTHFAHNRIIQYENRPFVDTKEMDEYLIYEWNRVVKATDTVYHLGDFAFAKKDYIRHLVSRLNGNKILKLGNHDSESRTFWLNAGFSEVHKQNFTLGDFILSHAPIENTTTFNIHGHVHSQIADLDQNFYRCVSVECTNYRPIHIDEIGG